MIAKVQLPQPSSTAVSFSDDSPFPKRPTRAYSVDSCVEHSENQNARGFHVGSCNNSDSSIGLMENSDSSFDTMDDSNDFNNNNSVATDHHEIEDETEDIRRDD